MNIYLTTKPIPSAMPAPVRKAYLFCKLKCAKFKERFSIIDQLQAKQPDLLPEQVEADVEAMLKQVRANRATRGN